MNDFWVKFITFPRHEQLYVSKATASFWTIFCLVSSQTHSLTDFVNPKHRRLQVASNNCTSWNVLQEYEIHEVFWSFKVLHHVISLSRPFPLRFDGADVGVWSLPFQSTVSWWRCCEHPFVSPNQRACKIPCLGGPAVQSTTKFSHNQVCMNLRSRPSTTFDRNA